MIRYNGVLAFFDHFVIRETAPRLRQLALQAVNTYRLQLQIGSNAEVREETLHAMVGSFKTIHDIEATETEYGMNKDEHVVVETASKVAHDTFIEKSIIKLVVEQLVARQLAERVEPSDVSSDVDSNAPAMKVLYQKMQTEKLESTRRQCLLLEAIAHANRMRGRGQCGEPTHDISVEQLYKSANGRLVLTVGQY